jgi:hypothetical protein
MRVRSGHDTLKIRRFVNSGRTGSIPVSVSVTNIHAPYRGLALLEGFFYVCFHFVQLLHK